MVSNPELTLDYARQEVAMRDGTVVADLVTAGGAHQSVWRRGLLVHVTSLQTVASFKTSIRGTTTTVSSNEFQVNRSKRG